MDTVATIDFREASTGDRGAIIVRSAPGVLGLALTLEDDGDIEALLPADACRRVIHALERALQPS